MIDEKSLLFSKIVFDISYNGMPSSEGWKVSVVGKSIEDAIFLFDKLHQWLYIKNIAHKIATVKRVEHYDYEQSKKLMTIYIPNGIDKMLFMLKLEILLKGYKGWYGIKLPLTGYDHYSNGIFYRNDRDHYGNYISTKELI